LFCGAAKEEKVPPIAMEKLTQKEEELMRHFWAHGPLFVREVVALCPEPRPHFNTVSTIVRTLEAKGYLSHTAFGATYQYYPVVSEEEFSRQTLGGVIRKYFENSYMGAVSALVEEEKISVDELRELIERIERENSR
jgi:predicted transcriptional regulator